MSDQIQSDVDNQTKKKERNKPLPIWKDTKHDGIIPIVNFVEGI